MSRADRTGTRPRWERRKRARPSELTSAALTLFMEKGYAGTRLEDVAARAGVSKGTLYLYFDSKEELFKAAVRDSLIRDIEQAGAVVAGFEGPTADLLRQLLVGGWHGTARAGGIVKLILAEGGKFPQIAKFYYDEVIRPSQQLLQSALERGIARGEFRAVPAQAFARVIAAPLIMLPLWQHSFGAYCDDWVDAQQYLAVLAETALAGLVGIGAAKSAAPAAAAAGPPAGTVPVRRLRSNA